VERLGGFAKSKGTIALRWRWTTRPVGSDFLHSGRYEQLGLPRLEVLEAVYPNAGRQFQRVWTLHVHVGHVVGLVEQKAGGWPTTLFISPIRKFTGNNWVHIRSSLGIPQPLTGFPAICRSSSRFLSFTLAPSEHPRMRALLRPRPLHSEIVYVYSQARQGSRACIASSAEHKGAVVHRLQ
jgi:hypothetical protein